MKSVFVKWRYNDHGWPDFKELEVPEWALQEWDSEDESIENYIVENCNIPTWSERYMSGRLKWERITKTHAEMQEIYKKKINGLRVAIADCEGKIKNFENLLDPGTE